MKSATSAVCALRRMDAAVMHAQRSRSKRICSLGSSVPEGKRRCALGSGFLKRPCSNPSAPGNSMAFSAPQALTAQFLGLLAIDLSYASRVTSPAPNALNMPSIFLAWLRARRAPCWPDVRLVKVKVPELAGAQPRTMAAL